VKEYALTDDESRLARDVEEGDICDFSKDRPARPVIRAEVIRRLLLGLPVKLTGEDKDNPRVITAPGTGIHLVYAQIDGELILEDGRDRDGSALHALAMERCIIPGTIKLSRSRFRSLSFDGSKLTHLSARDLHIEGSLNLSGVASAEIGPSGTGEDGRGLCWVELHRADIEGGIDAGNGEFTAPPKRLDIDPSSNSHNYAFNIRSAHVRDSVLLEPCVTAIGGICFQDAKIGGDIRARGGYFEGRERFGLCGGSAQIGGRLFLSHYESATSVTTTKIIGDLWLLGIKIGGDLRIRDAEIRGNIILSKAIVVSTLRLHKVRMLRLRRCDDPIPEKHPTKLWYLTEKVRYRYSRFDPTIELTGANVGILDDTNGRGLVGRFHLMLDGFEYHRLKIANDFNIWFTLFSLLRGLLIVFGFLYLAYLFKNGMQHFVQRFLGYILSPELREYSGQYTVAILIILGVVTGLLVISLAVSELRASLPQWRARRRWLNRQYPHRLISLNEDSYDPSPYEHLTRVLRSQGLFVDARRIASRRLSLERRLRTPAAYRLVLWLYWLCFDYGLSSWRALLTFLICITLGAYAVGIADYGYSAHNAQIPYLPRAVSQQFLSMLPQINRVLVIQANPVNSTVEETPDKRGHMLVFDKASHNDAVEGELACGNLIEPLLYATDVFIPALDLQQETRCMISTKDSAKMWRIARVLYSLLGWIVVSLTILTISGILRRQAEA
jgi:hypothetical protein